MEALDRLVFTAAELNDRRVSKRWRSFVSGAVSLPAEQAVTPEREAILTRRHDQLIRRLNRVERSR